MGLNPGGSSNVTPLSVSNSSSTTTTPYAHVGLQSHANNPSVGGKLEMMRVRATDPRPCPKCGKIYRSAHTLRTHMEVSFLFFLNLFFYLIIFLLSGQAHPVP